MLRAVNQYGFYCIPEQYKKREVSRILLKGEVNEPNTIALIRKFAGDGDIISGGCFIGDFMPALAQAAGKRQVHSFEPNPDSFDASTTTLKMNNIQNVKLHPVAVGEKADTLHLQITSSKGRILGGMSTIVEEAAEGQTIEVAVTPLDDLVPKTRKVSVLHLDVEGHEWPAVLGAQRIIAKNTPLLVLEATKDWQHRAYEEKLRETFPDLNYTLMGAMERNGFYLPQD
ncbi:FkbM family methyltransferase [Ascidiaceihabitans sp.]|uniref:FkbM family methyltransferase n=1 Tax=Ascidiaceihabitans sp. TaxID=1872644 RepID=UPI003296B51D